MQQRERKLSVFLSGLALSLAVIAANAASDKGREETSNLDREAEFEKEKIIYIKQYALPKPAGPLKTELLFTKRTTIPRPTSTTTGAPNTATTTPPNNSSNLSQPASSSASEMGAAPPPAAEPTHD